VTLEGQVPSEQVKNVAGAIAQDTSGVKQVHNNVAVNPAIERNRIASISENALRI
jgi:osmotically-inducible protein OsmY